MDNQNVTKKKGWLVGLLIGVAVAALIAVAVIIAIVVGVSGSGSRKLKKQLELGDKYLTEQDYEKAILAYEEAIKINPKSEEAYEGLGEAYLGQAEDLLSDGDVAGAEKALDEAISVIENGEKKTESDKVKKVKKKLTEKKDEVKKKEETGGGDTKPGESGDKKEADESNPALAEAYSNYLAYLQSHENECRAHVNEQAVDEECISFCDVTGDEIPEMIYLSNYIDNVNGNNSTLVIAGIKNGTVTDLGGVSQHAVVGFGGEHHLLYTVNGKTSVYGISENYDRDFLEIKSTDGKMKEEVLFTEPTWILESGIEGETPVWYDGKGNQISEEEFNRKKNELFSNASQIIGYCKCYKDGGMCSREDTRELFSHAEDITMSYDEAIAYLKNKISENGGEKPKNQSGQSNETKDAEPEATIELTWDISTVTVFDDPNNGEFYDANNCDLRVDLSIFGNNGEVIRSNAGNGQTDYRDASGNLLVTEKLEQTGNTKKYICTVYSLDCSFDLEAVSVTLINGLPDYPMNAVITQKGKETKELSRDDMARRAYTGIWYLGICSLHNGQLTDYIVPETDNAVPW